MILQTIAATFLFLQSAGGSIGGTIIDSTTGQPIADARIEITRVPTPASPPVAGQPAVATTFRPSRIPPATSDAGGRFAFQFLELGPYLVRVSKEGIAEENTNIGANATSTQLTLNERDPSRTLTFRLTPGGAISGQVTGRDGKPVANMEVAVFTSRYDPEGHQAYILSASANSNDRGEYRIFPVQPGQYYLSVGAPSRPIPGVRPTNPLNNPKNQYPRLFYPGVEAPESASLIRVQSRGELSGMDFQLSEQPTFRIRGRLTDSRTGEVPQNAGLSIARRETNISTNSAAFANIADPSDGSFELQNVAPGRYIITAQSGIVVRIVAVQPGGAAPAPVAPVQPTAPGNAIAAVDVTTRDVDGVVLNFVPPFAISGKLQMQNGTPVPDGIRANIVLRPNALAALTAGTRAVRWNADGSFTIEGVVPGEYYVSVSPTRTGAGGPLPYVRDVRAGEVDLLLHSMVVVGPRADGIVITLAQNGGVISGTVNRSSAETTDRVVLVPTDRSARTLYRTSSISPSGGFTLQAVPPGTYKAFALGGVEGSPWFDPAYLAPIEGSGTPVTVGESANVALSLTLVQRP